MARNLRAIALGKRSSGQPSRAACRWRSLRHHAVARDALPVAEVRPGAADVVAGFAQVVNASAEAEAVEAAQREQGRDGAAFAQPSEDVGGLREFGHENSPARMRSAYFFG